MTADSKEWLIRVGFSVVGLIHLLPLVGVSGAGALERAYGVRIDSPEIRLLLQDRADVGCGGGRHG